MSEPTKILSDARQRELYGSKNTEANRKSDNTQKSKVVSAHAVKACRVREV